MVESPEEFNGYYIDFLKSILNKDIFELSSLDFTNSLALLSANSSKELIYNVLPYLEDVVIKYNLCEMLDKACLVNFCKHIVKMDLSTDSIYILECILESLGVYNADILKMDHSLNQIISMKIMMVILILNTIYLSNKTEASF